MTDATPDGSLPVADLDRLIAICDRFEADWKSGRPRSIEDELREAPEPLLDRLLRDLLALELEARGAGGGGPGRTSTARGSPSRPEWSMPRSPRTGRHSP